MIDGCREQLSALGVVVASNGEAGLPWWWRCVSVIEA
jgi:hypothetical protein